MMRKGKIIGNILSYEIKRSIAQAVVNTRRYSKKYKKFEKNYEI